MGLFSKLIKCLGKNVILTQVHINVIDALAAAAHTVKIILRKVFKWLRRRFPTPLTAGRSLTCSLVILLPHKLHSHSAHTHTPVSFKASKLSNVTLSHVRHIQGCSFADPKWIPFFFPEREQCLSNSRVKLSEVAGVITSGAALVSPSRGWIGPFVRRSDARSCRAGS